MAAVTLAALTLYPVRSAAGTAVDRAVLTTGGLAGDRRWLLLRAGGTALTLKNCPALTRLHPEPERDGVLVIRHRDGGPPLVVPVPAAGAVVSVPQRDGGGVPARAAGPDADARLSTWLNEPVRLLRLADDAVMNRYPLLLAGTASVDRLAAWLGHPVDPARFRANLLAATVAPWEEETWRAVRVGDVVCDVVKPCPRCPVITVDPQTGRRDPEVLARLAREHATAGGRPAMGVFLVPRHGGTLAAGDPVVPL